MKITNKDVEIFRIKNRRGYAAICDDHLTEGKTSQEAYQRMIKAIQRTQKKILSRSK